MKYSKEDLRNFTLFLSRQKGIGPITFAQLLTHYDSVQNLLKAYLEKDISFVKNYVDFEQILNLKIVGELQKLNINFKCVWEEDYPKNLKNIADPPIVIFYKGEWDSHVLNNSLSVVGTRKATSYGSKIIKNFVPKLVEAGFSIVSGMAFGVDKLAHLSTIEASGKTIAVLASSVHTATPVNNKDVYDKILSSGGLILSEYAPDVEIVPGLFASRNRIVAGLTLGTLIVEAGAKSGALITGDLAFNYNRDVFAVPGMLDNSLSEGCNKIIKEGKAKLVQDASDILIEYGFSLSESANSYNDKIKSLTNEELEVYNSILFSPKFLEEIAMDIKKDVAKVVLQCTLLEVKGIVSKSNLGKYMVA